MSDDFQSVETANLLIRKGKKVPILQRSTRRSIVYSSSLKIGLTENYEKAIRISRISELRFMDRVEKSRRPLRNKDSGLKLRTGVALMTFVRSRVFGNTFACLPFNAAAKSFPVESKGR